MNSKVERILDWRESFSTLPDDYFFDIIHIYLGEIKTPYNKPKLVEELSTVLRKKENKENLINYLDEKDVRILTAIKFIPDADGEKLEKFFVPSMSEGELYEEIASLEERLIIYNRTDSLSGKVTIAINPHLEEELEPVLNMGNLVCQEKSEGLKSVEPEFFLCPQIIAVFISYVLLHPDFCKASGELKKKTVSDLKEICNSDSVEIFQTLFIAMRNLVLLRQRNDEKGWEPDWNRLNNFARLPFKSQAIYLCVAGAGTFSRRTLISNATFLSQTIDFAAGKFFSKKKLFAIAFLIKEKSGTEDFGTRRFSRILAGNSEEKEYIGSAAVEAMIDAAVAFGIMGKCTGDSNEEIYTGGTFEGAYEAQDKKLLSVDNGYNVTVMPGLTLEEYLPLVKFLDVRNCNVTATFEITRTSVMRGFDSGFTMETIAEELKKYSSFGLPQNLSVSLEEWSQTYSSASIYKGYVIKLSEENRLRAENNPLLKNHIAEVLAPGVYLLDFENDSQVDEVLSKTGIEFAGKIKGVVKNEEAAALPLIGKSNSSISSLEDFSDSSEEFVVEHEKRKSLIDGFKKHLESMELTRDQKDGLLDRISRRLIIEEAQLRPESVRFELMEAFGMNFTGKVHVLERAIQKNSIVEIELTGTDGVILGTPKGILKNSEVPLVFLSVENRETGEPEDKEIVIAKISRVKRIRSSLSLRKIK